MDTIYKYFLKEMAWLEQAGKEFADANPGLDTFLHGGRTVGDPHVDRVLEGVAFLAARLEKRLDDSLMDVADDILDLTFPELKEPQPAMTIIRYVPRTELRQIVEVSDGAELISQTARSLNKKIRLRTADSTTLGDFDLVKAEVDSTTHIGQTSLRLVIRAKNGGFLASKEPLPRELPILLFWNNLTDSCAIRSAFRHLSDPPRFLGLDENGAELDLGSTPGFEIKPLRSYAPILDSRGSSFPGFRVLREFFALPQRFLKIILTGLDRCDALANARELVIEFALPLSEREMPPLNERNFMLFTSAAINSWSGTSKPLTCDGTKDRYFIEPDHSGNLAPLFVKNVRMLRRGDDRFLDIPEFNYLSQDHACYKVSFESYNMSEKKQSVRWFLDVKNVASPGQLTTVSCDLQLADLDAIESLGVQANLSNYTGVPETVSTATILPCSDFVPAMNSEGQYWQLIDMISCNLSSLSNPKRLQMFLKHLNRTENKVANAAIDGILETKLEMKATTLMQQPVKLANMDIGVDREKFLNRGYLELFFDVFQEFLRGFIPLNCLLELQVYDVNTKEILCRWKPEKPTSHQT